MENVLFASDLDQTLIYSQRTFMNQELAEQLRPVELLVDRYISYMTQTALGQLRTLGQRLVFVPVTTRTILQYQRINFSAYGISHQYAVTSNGGTIFFNGREEKDWTRQVSVGSDQCLAAQDLISRFREISHPSWVVRDSGKLADNLFYYCLIDREKMPLLELAAFKCWASENNWELSIQGRKLYLVPQNVNKQAAVQYIREKEGLSRVVAAGDSLLDLKMLIAADLALAPAHGEIYALYSQGRADLENIRFTTKSGPEAAEEILDAVSGSLFKQAVV